MIPVDTLIETGIGILLGAGAIALALGIVIAIEEWETIVIKLRAANPFHTAGPSPEKLKPVDTDSKIYGRIGDGGVIEDPEDVDKPDLHADVKEGDSTPNVHADGNSVEPNGNPLSRVSGDVIRLDPDGSFEVSNGHFPVADGQITSDEITGEQLRFLIESTGATAIRLRAPQEVYNFDRNAYRLAVD